MKAELLLRQKSVLSDGAIVEWVIWRVPSPVAGSRHGYNYSLFYGKDGVRIVGYDNKRPRAITATSRGGRSLTASPRSNVWSPIF